VQEILSGLSYDFTAIGPGVVNVQVGVYIERDGQFGWEYRLISVSDDDFTDDGLPRKDITVNADGTVTGATQASGGLGTGAIVDTLRDIDNLANTRHVSELTAQYETADQVQNVRNSVDALGPKLDAIRLAVEGIPSAGGGTNVLDNSGVVGQLQLLTTNNYQTQYSDTYNPFAPWDSMNKFSIDDPMSESPLQQGDITSYLKADIRNEPWVAVWMEPVKALIGMVITLIAALAWYDEVKNALFGCIAIPSTSSNSGGALPGAAGIIAGSKFAAYVPLVGSIPVLGASIAVLCLGPTWVFSITAITQATDAIGFWGPIKFGIGMMPSFLPMTVIWCVMALFILKKPVLHATAFGAMLAAKILWAI